MVTRRELLGGSVFGAAAPGGAAPTWMGEQTPTSDPRQLRELIARVEQIGDELRAANGASFTGASQVVEKIRDAMTLFLRGSQKYPDYIEVGYGVFHAMYDWHIRNQQPLNVSRSADGRYGLAFMFTRLLLRPDVVADFISVPYDQRA